MSPQAAEQKTATDFIRTAYSCDQVRALGIQVERRGLRLSPLYVPAYVISGRQMMGGKIRTFVSGANSQQVCVTSERVGGFCLHMHSTLSMKPSHLLVLPYDLPRKLGTCSL